MKNLTRNKISIYLTNFRPIQIRQFIYCFNHFGIQFSNLSFRINYFIRSGRNFSEWAIFITIPLIFAVKFEVSVNDCHLTVQLWHFAWFFCTIWIDLSQKLELIFFFNFPTNFQCIGRTYSEIEENFKTSEINLCGHFWRNWSVFFTFLQQTCA